MLDFYPQGAPSHINQQNALAFCDLKIGFSYKFIKDILEGDKKEKINKQDFGLMEGYLDSLKEYNKILEEEGINNVSIEIVKIFIFGQTPEEFRKFIKNNDIKDLIKSGKPENIKLFFGEDFYNIKNTEELEELINNNPNWEDIKYLIKWGKLENIKFFFGEDGIIKNTDDLEKLMKNPNWEDINNLIEYGELENIKLFFGEDFYNIKNTEELEELINNNTNWGDIINLIEYGEPENIKLFFGEDGIIKNIKDLGELMNSGKWEHIKKAITIEGKKEIKEIFNLKKYRSNTFKLKYKNLYKNIGSCPYNEKYNLQILKNKEYNNSTIIKIGDKVIGIIKKIGTKSFLSFENVFDEKGYLIFAKGWIYNLVLNTDIGNNKGIVLLEEKSVKRNPIRKIEEKNNPELYNDFDKLVEEFLNNI
ncbi:MAG: hypothetical protein Q9M94_03390 [Candidatus Gracilibacteria bacterium]|nr:hypothetical protein [Candidatus Gracilibacteria bacterium]